MRTRAVNTPGALCTSRRSLVDAGCPAKQRWTGLPIRSSHSTSSQQLPSWRYYFSNLPTHFPHALLTAAFTCCTSGVVCFGAYPAVLVQEPVISIPTLHPVLINSWKMSHGSKSAKAITHAAHQCMPVSYCCQILFCLSHAGKFVHACSHTDRLTLPVSHHCKSCPLRCFRWKCTRDLERCWRASYTGVAWSCGTWGPHPCTMYEWLSAILMSSAQ